MSYYQKNNFTFTAHALVRAKQRIPNLSQASNLIIQAQILDWLRYAPIPEFIDYKYAYFHIACPNQKYLYAIVTKDTNTIVTITIILPGRKLEF